MTTTISRLNTYNGSIPMRFLAIGLVALAFLAGPMRATAAPTASCADLDAYFLEIIRAADRDDLEWLFALDDSDMSMARPSEMARASRVFDDWAAALDAMPTRDVPVVARDYHEAFVDFLSVSSAMFNSIATTGPLGALAYTDAMDTVTADLDQADQAAALACPRDWPFDDDDDEEVL